MQCPNPKCNATISDDANFCCRCGTPLVAMSEANTVVIPAGSGPAGAAAAAASADDTPGTKAPASSTASTASAADAAATANEPNGTSAADAAPTRAATDPDAHGTHSPRESVADVAQDMGFGFSANSAPANAANAANAADPTRPYSAKSPWQADPTDEMPATPGATSAQNGATPAEKRNVARIAIVVVALLAAIACLIAALYHFGYIGDPYVPEVEGKTQAEATALLESKGFQVTVEEVSSDSAEGTVIQSDPAADERAPKNSTVKISVAIPYTMPDVLGKDSTEVQKMLKDLGFTQVTTTAKKSDEPEGTVLQTNQKTGATLKHNSAIVLTVAEPYTVPKLVGLTEEKAVEALAEAGLATYVFVDDYESTAADGTVSSCSPEEGATVKSTAQITVNIARDRGKELTSLAEAFLTGTQTIDGGTYQIESASSISYLGNNTVSFAIAAKPVFTLLGLSYTEATESFVGTLTFSDDNVLLSSTIDRAGY